MDQPADEDNWTDTPDYPHRIENHVKVYLHVEQTTSGVAGWVVSGVTVDGYALDGTEDGNYCGYEGHPTGARVDWDPQHQRRPRTLICPPPRSCSRSSLTPWAPASTGPRPRRCARPLT